jgi:hypothetical protein
MVEELDGVRVPREGGWRIFAGFFFLGNWSMWRCHAGGIHHRDHTEKAWAHAATSAMEAPYAL